MVSGTSGCIKNLTTSKFLNDISLCPNDILELLHQRIFQKADIPYAMNWSYLGADPIFYDFWTRGMNGDTFFEIPSDGNWNSVWNIFWNNPEARASYNAHKPFQVFSCWNGGTAITGAPFMSGRVQFRAHKEGESFKGEPKLLAKDLWSLGYGKIAVVPSVNVEYSNDAARRIKALKGFTSEWVEKEGDA